MGLTDNLKRFEEIYAPTVTEEDMAAAHRYMRKHGAEDLVEMLTL